MACSGRRQAQGWRLPPWSGLGTRTTCGADGAGDGGGAWQKMDGVRVGATGSALRAPLVTADVDDDTREIKYLH